MTGFRHRLAVTLLAVALLSSCSGAPQRDVAPAPLAPQATSLADVVSLVDGASARILALAGVNGIGVSVSGGAPAVLVLLDHVGVLGLPASLGAVPVVTEVVGTVRPFSLTGRYRPVPIGVSGGNANECLPGTIGCVLLGGGKRYLLSANHVFARQNQAALGEVIVQPSRPDSDPACGPPPASTMVARLSDFEPVVYDGSTLNVMDAAIAELTTTDFTCATLPAYYGQPSTLAVAPATGAAILKVGRTTELTRGTIKAIDVKVKITFPSGTALFVGQVLTSKDFGAFGDSGSLVVTDDGGFHPVGMLIGGGSNGVAIVSPIGPILERFHATVCGQ